MIQMQEDLPGKLLDTLSALYIEQFERYELGGKLALTRAWDFNILMDKKNIQLEMSLGLSYSVNKSISWAGKLRVRLSLILFSDNIFQSPEIRLENAEWIGKPVLKGSSVSWNVRIISQIVLFLSKKSIESRMNKALSSRFNYGEILHEMSVLLTHFLTRADSIYPKLNFKFYKLDFDIRKSTGRIILPLRVSFQAESIPLPNKLSGINHIFKLTGQTDKAEYIDVQIMVPWDKLSELISDSGYAFSVHLPVINSKCKPVNVTFKNERLMLDLELSGMINSHLSLFIEPMVSNEKLHLKLVDLKINTGSGIQNVIVSLGKAKLLQVIQQAIDKQLENFDNILKANLPDEFEVLKEAWGIDLSLEFSALIFNKCNLNAVGFLMEFKAAIQAEADVFSADLIAASLLKNLLVVKS